MTKKNKKASLQIKLESSDIRIVLFINALINIGILIAIPPHFSFISLSILLPSLLAFMQSKKQMQSRSFRLGSFLGLTVSILFAMLAYYWISKGPDGCAAFFGEYVSCFSYENLQYPLLELYVTPAVLLLISKPLLQGMNFLKVSR